MNYFILFLSVVISIFLIGLIFTCTFNKEQTLSKKFKLALMIVIAMLPLVMLIGGTLFLSFKVVIYLLNINISNFKLLLISMLGVIIIFICDFVSKKIVTSIVAKVLSKKYENQSLTEIEIMEVVKNQQDGMRLLTLAIMFITSIILYLISMYLISIDFTLIFLVIISFVNILSYKIFFRSSYKEAK